MQRAPTDSAAVRIDEEAGFGGAAILLVVARRAAGVAGPAHRGGAVSRGLGRAVCRRGTPRVPPAAGSRGQLPHSKGLARTGAGIGTGMGMGMRTGKRTIRAGK